MNISFLVVLYQMMLVGADDSIVQTDILMKHCPEHYYYYYN